MTPQELMDLPYAGMVEKQLRKQGNWDESAALDGVSECEVTVKINGSYDPEVEIQEYTVVAKTKSEAIALAEELCDFDDIQDISVAHVEVGDNQ